MTDATPQRLMQIDSAVRTPGGLADLIQHTPDIEAWLTWIIQTMKTPTCGALEELRYDRKLSHAAQTFASDGLHPFEACLVRLVDADETPVPARQVAAGVWRFTIAKPGSFRLFTLDRTLLWGEDLSSACDNPDNNSVWRLAAASKPSGPVVQRWTIPGWTLTIEHLQTATGHWLDIIDHEEVV